jgi:Flp pilus assembly protein TadD
VSDVLVTGVAGFLGSHVAVPVCRGGHPRLKSARERFDAGDPYEAIHLLTELVASGQAFADAHNLYGLCHAIVGRQEEALAAFDRALQLNARYVDAHASLGMACYLMKDLPAARAAWERAHALAPDDKRISAYLALLARVGG